MKALVLHEQKSIFDNPLILEERSPPLPGEGEVRIRILASGICLTDCHIIEGDLPLKKGPIIPGHQGVGIVDLLGEKVQSVHLGEKVGVPWLHDVCHRCEYCHNERFNLCDDPTFTGYHRDGSYAEYMIAKESALISLSEDIRPEEVAPLLCAGIVGYRSYKQTQVKKGERLGLAGFGSSAHIVLQIAKYHGIDVSVFTRSKDHQAFARKLGCSWVGTIEEKPPHLVDALISFAPSGEVAALALSHVKKGGRVIINAIYASRLPPIPYHQLYYEKSLSTTANATFNDGKEFFMLNQSMKIVPRIEVFPFKKANTALQMLKKSRFNGAGVLIP